MRWAEGRVSSLLKVRKREKPPVGFAAYLQKVCGCVKWRRARGAVKEELLGHLEDQRDAFLEAGLEREEAERRAVEDIGPAELVGTELDKAYRPRRVWLLLLAAFLLAGLTAAAITALGVTVKSMGPDWSWVLEPNGPYGWFKTFPAWAVGGAAAFLLAYCSGPRCWVRCGYALPAGYAAVWLALSRMIRWWWENPARLEEGGYFLCLELESVMIALAPLMGALLLYRLHGKGWRGALAFAGVCLLFWEWIGKHGNSARLTAAGLLAGLLLWGLWSGWFGGSLAGYRKLAAAVTAAFLLICSAGKIVSGINGLLFEFGNQGYGAGYFGSGELAEPGYFLTMAPNWIGPAENAGWLYSGHLLLDAVRHWGLACLLAVAGLLTVFFIRCLAEWHRQRKWLGKTVVAAAGLYLFFTGLLEIGSITGLWAAQYLDLPFACGGSGFVISMALLGAIAAAARDGALIPGRRAEAR